MSRKPRTPAQLKHSTAGKKAAATAKKHFAAMTPKQQAAEHAKRHRAAEKAAKANAARIKAFEAAHHGRAPRPARKLICPYPVSDRRQLSWILGENDTIDCCVATAIANSFLLGTKLNPYADEVTNLCYAIPDVSIAFGLEMAATMRFMQWRPRFREVLDDTPGAILGVQLHRSQLDQPSWDWCAVGDEYESGAHAVVRTENGVITWGEEISVTDAFLRVQVEEAWQVEWERI